MKTLNDEVTMERKIKATILTKLVDFSAGSMTPEVFKLFVINNIKRKYGKIGIFKKTLEQHLDLFDIENEYCVRILAYITNNILVIQVTGDNLILNFETQMDTPS